jgi:cytochrome c-type biogenesis protein CcmH/NrfG
MQLIQYAERLHREHRYLPGEKVNLEILKFDHKNVAAYRRLAAAYRATGNLADAIECHQIICRLDPSATAFTDLGKALVDNRNFVKATIALEKAIVFEPSAFRYASLARVYQRTANHQKAVEALRAAIKLNSDVGFWLQLAEAAVLAGDQTTAADAFNEVVRQDPSNLKAKHYLSRIDSLEKSSA